MRARRSSWTSRLPRIVICLVLTHLASAAARPASASPDEIAALLNEIQVLSAEALAAAETAASAATVDEVKRAADAVYQRMWGLSSGLAEPGATGAEAAHGWKERWQTDETHFDSAYSVRYSGRPPTIDDPRALGIIGRGRHVRLLLDALIGDSTTAADQRLHAEHVRISLNNVIGWQKMDTGRIKNEIQPRVDLTRLWDAPVAFWNSTSDTGWAFEALAQALNILKVEYADVAEARAHAADMADLIRRYMDGVDADGDGAVAPVMMEGGLQTALAHARLAGIEE